MIMEIDRIKLFKEYRNSDLSFIPDVEEINGIMPGTDDETMIGMIFAPDPQTGFPRSDLAIVLSKDSAPEVAQYVRDTLMSSNPNVVNAGDDPDLALAGIKSRDETFVEYAERLRSIVNGQSESK